MNKPYCWLLNQKFDKWLVTDGPKVQIDKSGQNRSHWLCKCDCGKERWVYQHSLTSGKSTSCGCSLRMEFGQASKHNVYVGYKGKCVRQKIEFKLTEQEFNVFIDKDCFYCGKPPSNKIQHGKCFGHYIYNGIDRINNDKGYTIDNCITSCKDCNLAKRKLTQDQFLNMIKMIYERHKLNEKK